VPVVKTGLQHLHALRDAAEQTGQPPGSGFLWETSSVVRSRSSLPGMAWIVQGVHAGLTANLSSLSILREKWD
jgi:hypothetical protein